MNKMREAFEREFPEVDDPVIQAYFEAGYQAAIADVKAGGAVGRVAIKMYPFVADTYKLEDV